jgi:hypothetical protein
MLKEVVHVRNWSFNRSYIWNCWCSSEIVRDVFADYDKGLQFLRDMKNYSCNDMLHPRGPGSFSELFTKHIMESSDPGEFPEAWVGWWQMW